MTAIRAISMQTPRRWRTVAHPKAREKPPKPFSWLDRQASGSLKRAHHGCAAASQTGPARLGRREDPARHRRKRTSPAASMIETLCRARVRKRGEDADAAR